MDISEADQLLRKKGSPRAQYVAASLLWPAKQGILLDQPYYVFTMRPDSLSAKYLFVGVFDRTVAASDHFDTGDGGDDWGGLLAAE